LDLEEVGVGEVVTGSWVVSAEVTVEDGVGGVVTEEDGEVGVVSGLTDFQPLFTVVGGAGKHDKKLERNVLI
jgi:hypothetical protein